MGITDTERREGARQFYNKWNGHGKEDEDDRSYWIDILERIMGVENVTDHIEFQKKVIVDGNTKKIDAYIPETKVLIEQKSLGIALDKKGHQSGGIMLTPYEQAKRYNDNLPYDEKAKWIVTSNFAEIWIYDMNTSVPTPVKISIMELQTKYSMLDFLINQEKKKVNLEMEVSLKAGDLVGVMYDAFLKQYSNPDDPEVLKSLNKLCVRIVFCLYAEDAGIFGKKDLFHDYLQQFSVKDARKGLRDLFRVLNQKPEERDKYLKDDDPILASFPYVNGGLFADDDIEIPPLTEEIIDLIINKASFDFDWSVISPTIFGAVFESTLNPETRRSGGMHYTSIENIHKVIDPLFLDELKAEFEDIKSIQVLRTRNQKLKDFQNKLASLKWLDPACGSGNFLTETYISIRRLENEVIRELKGDQMSFGFEDANPIKVSISQFFGIEINDFAVTVAKTALWIAESQMMKETESIVLMELDFLPLKTNAYIVEGNALRMDWDSILEMQNLSYIMGNPPFVSQGGSSDRGQRQQGAGRSREQAEDMVIIFNNEKGTGNLDYVSCWFRKTYNYMKLHTKVHAAFVSTNSICQGQQVLPLWKPMVSNGLKINFAHQSFKWGSESDKSAVVFVVIIGFSIENRVSKKIYKYNNYQGKAICVTTDKINSYLLDNAPDVYIDTRSKPLCKEVSQMVRGGGASDWGFLMLSEEERTELIKKEPESAKWIRPFLQGNEFLKSIPRYCLWMVGITPNELNKLTQIKERVKNVKEKRLESKKISTRKKAETPWLFDEIIQIDSPNYIAIPQVSSGNRRYIPMGYVSSDVIAGNKLLMIPNGTLYEFGVLCSNIHNAWVRIVASHYGPSYQYSANIAYNNFPWCNPTEEQRKKIEETAQGILDARALYPDCSLADLYDPLTMPPELQKAHTANDIAVMKAYGFNIKETSEASCVAELMRMYQELVQQGKE